MYDSTHSLRFIPDTYFTVFGIGGTTLCRGMKVRRWLTGGVNHVVGTGRKACVRYGPLNSWWPGAESNQGRGCLTLAQDFFELRDIPIITTAANTSAITNPNTSLGAMPTKVLVRLLAKATAGLAKKVDEVNQ